MKELGCGCAVVSLTLCGSGKRQQSQRSPVARVPHVSNYRLNRKAIGKRRFVSRLGTGVTRRVLEYNRIVEGTDMKIRLTVISFALAIAAVAFLLVAPVYSGRRMVTQIRGSETRSTVHSSSATLLQVNGSAALIPV